MPGQQAGREKPIYDKPHKWNTNWLGWDTSVTDIDLAASGKSGRNVYEIKHRAAFLNKVQRELLAIDRLIHIVILNRPNEPNVDGKYQFEALSYEIYCPWAKQEVEYVEHRRSWRVTSPPQAYITKDEARAIFRGDAPWPCCGRATFPR